MVLAFAWHMHMRDKVVCPCIGTQVDPGPALPSPSSGQACAGVFNEVIVTNTIPLADEKRFAQLTILSVANLLGENIWKIYNQHPGRQ